MKNVIIHQIRLLNFKGQRDLTVKFDPVATSIYGANGTGKSTIFDAFTWVLWGKDSHDRKDFDIKTLDAAGKAIPRIPHEVSIELTIGRTPITLTRRYNEIWRKKRGSATEEFVGHEEERLYNDVPCSVTEWKSKIAEICSEEDFKFLSNPAYFTSQKADKQRKKLSEMAGTISDDDLAKGNLDFIALLEKLKNKSLDELKREIASKKRRCKAELDNLPARIDERKRDMPEATEWEQVESQLAEKQAALVELEKILADEAQKASTAGNARLALVRRISDYKANLQNLECKLREDVMEEYHDAIAEINDSKRKVTQLDREINALEEEIRYYTLKIEDFDHARAELIKEWKSLQAQTLTFNSGDFNCPTCGQPYDAEKVAKMQSDMLARFNAQKSAQIAENVKKGTTIKQQKEVAVKRISDAELKIINLREQREKATVKFPFTPTPPSAAKLQSIYNGNEVHKKLCALISASEEELQNMQQLPPTENNSQYLEAKEVLRGNIDELKAILARRDIITRNEQRIAELEADLRANAQELAALEGLEFTIAAFSKARIEAVEARINSMFRIVKFKMFEQQINGGEIETCEATVNGVPYSSLNTAMQVNAGLDIINAISKHQDIAVPIFIENAEGVLELEPTEAQTIRLVVADVPKLTVTSKETKTNLLN